MQERRLDEILRSLGNEPLWAASAGSRELFHSDMLQWLTQHYPESLVSIFGLAGEEFKVPPRCERERRHLDVILRWEGGKTVVIENKLFSLPDEIQLARYENEQVTRLDTSNVDAVLLSLTDPHWPGGCWGRWRWVSYHDLGTRLIEFFGEGSDFPTELAAHWGKLCLLLDDVATELGVTSDEESYELDRRISDALGDRLRAFAVTLRANKVRRRISDQIHEPNVPVRVDYSHGFALIESFPVNLDGDELGWQFQEGQWRMAVRLPEGRLYESKPCYGRTTECVAARIAYAESRYAQHFSFHEIEESGIAIGKGKARKPFGSFNPDFVYKYRRLESPSVRQLVDLASRVTSRILTDNRVLPD